VVVGEARQDGSLIPHFHVDDVDEQDRTAFLASIVTALEYRKIQQTGVPEPQSSEDRLAQRGSI
jgi:hypothetical protein